MVDTLPDEVKVCKDKCDLSEQTAIQIRKEMRKI